jgi:hypothetical protein
LHSPFLTQRRRDAKGQTGRFETISPPARASDTAPEQKAARSAAFTPLRCRRQVN